MELGGGGCGRGGNTLKAAGSGRRIPTRQLSCRLCPTAPGLRLLPDLESSRWESHPSSHGRGWQHAAQGDHRGGGRLAPCPGAPGTSSHQRPFSLKSPWLGAVRRDRGGTRSPPPPNMGHASQAANAEGSRASSPGRTGRTAGSEGRAGACTAWGGWPNRRGRAGGFGAQWMLQGGRGGGGGNIQKHLGDAAGKSPSWRCGSRRAPLPRRPPSFLPRLLLPSIPASILRQVLAHVTGA